ncbi:hypothetical protein ACWDGI_13660 [Streptomyces sp. NPDC001220]
MSPDTLAPAPTVSGIPGRTDVLRTVPRRRYGQGAAAAGCFTSDSVPNGTGTAR